MYDGKKIMNKRMSILEWFGRVKKMNGSHLVNQIYRDDRVRMNQL